MVVKCLLCLEYPTIPGPKFLEIFGEEGLRLDISAIINKYFWLKTNRNCEDVQQICMTCWEVVRDFHILYQRVEEVHKHIGVKTIVLDDPLPQDVMLKSEDDPSMAQDPIMGDNGMGDNGIFDPEVKVEVHDLDLLPQIEILETANVPDRAARSSRRGRPPARDQSPKVATKRIKKEQSPAAESNIDVFASNESLAKDGLNDSGSMEDINYALLSNSLDKSDKDDGTSKRRGRPRKTEVEKTKTTTPRLKRSKKQQLQASETAIKNEKDVEDQPSCSTAQQANAGDASEPKIKTENSTDEQNFDSFAITAENFDDDDAYAQDDYDDDNDNYNKDSDDSSNSESESDASNGSDWGEAKKKKEKFAVIMKKERNVPKKYKKREKPLVEPKRMSREEIEARQAQQAEYDNIITKFFEKIRCPKCELLVHTFGEMRAHFRLDHNDDHGFVECCGRRFATRKFLAEHILVHYNPEHFKCKTCDKVCRDSTQLEGHEQSHLPNPPPSKYKKTFQCEKCSKTFSSKASFEHHMVAKHVPREEFKFECPECKKKWPSKAKLRKHMYCHDTNRQKICDQCGKTFACNSSMRKHVDAEHSEVKPEPEQCKICNTWYRNMSGLRTHMKFMHENIGGEHRCQICNKVSTNARALRRHIYLNHECERKFKCHMCEKAFKREQDLREHISVHTGEALYTCPNCPMTFSSSANMYKHRQRLHKAEYAAHKQQPMALNIIKQAKSVPNTVRTKRRMMVEPPQPAEIVMPPTSVLLNPQLIITSQYAAMAPNLTKLHD
ncbi:transcription factor grauzone-like isoform X2 [Calliphora vicina]|uniref:transcription factor grauzone-like isoform X2 n=1 Tax=Calliphora vicina TaxID=7373 RepID=UPI00325AB721